MKLKYYSNKKKKYNSINIKHDKHYNKDNQ